ncbi:protein mono-ADP-ribosyltransferase PARP8-like, partial [Salvelinus sp. IW2-2015]|uniref:protein mono-ADP-ribosyltransferase PARP8-like n=1 Tax=Salvelinus sp. IW2-2015 TaxID=2691554 RepID=UPI0038D48007
GIRAIDDVDIDPAHRRQFPRLRKSPSLGRDPQGAGDRASPLLSDTVPEWTSPHGGRVQVSTKDRFGLGHQLKKIMQTFVTQQWKTPKVKRSSTPFTTKTRTRRRSNPPPHLLNPPQISQLPASCCARARRI